VSLGIVRKHDGSIEIRSEEGRGTEVTVTLPRYDGE
jgi:signal transduction histidine kinase